MSSEKVVEKPEDLSEKLDALNVNADEEGSAEPKTRAERKNGKIRPRLPYEEREALIKEELEKKKVLETALTGTVRWYSVRGRYGFIERTDGGKDIFVHQTAISMSHTEKFYYRTLAAGEKVAFDVVEGHSGPEAANVTGPDGAKVKGFGYRPRRPNNRRLSVDKDGKKSETPEGEKVVNVKRNRNRKHRRGNDNKAKDANKSVEAEDDVEHGAASATTTSC